VAKLQVEKVEVRPSARAWSVRTPLEHRLPVDVDNDHFAVRPLYSHHPTALRLCLPVSRPKKHLKLSSPAACQSLKPLLNPNHKSPRPSQQALLTPQAAVSLMSPQAAFKPTIKPFHDVLLCLPQAAQAVFKLPRCHELAVNYQDPSPSQIPACAFVRTS
jgi:hypothetical protein